MNNNSIEILIFKALHGDITRAEQNKLDEILKSQPQWMIRYKEAKKIEDLLSQSVNIDPPSEIETNIMSAISTVKSRGRYGSFSLTNVIRGLLKVSTFKYVYAFAFGAIVAIILLAVVPVNINSFHPNTPELLTGSLIDISKLEYYDPVFEKSINYGSLNGNFCFYKIDSLLIGILELSAPSQITCNINFPVGQLTISTISMAPELTNFQLSPQGRLAFIHTGNGKYIIQFDQRYDNFSELTVETRFENNILDLNLLIGQAKLQ